MKLATLFFVLATPAWAAPGGLTISCQKDGHSLEALVDPSKGSSGEVSYHVSGPGYAYDGFIQDDPAAKYEQTLEFKKGDGLTVDAQIIKTEIVTYQECLEIVPNTRSCAIYSHGPHPHSTISQAFSLKLEASTDENGIKGGDKVVYLHIFNADPQLPGGYQFPDLKGAACTFTGAL